MSCLLTCPTLPPEAFLFTNFRYWNLVNGDWLIVNGRLLTALWHRFGICTLKFVILLLLSFRLMVLLGFLFRFKKSKPVAEADLPAVSVLVPARNESEVLANCLSALSRLRYPKGKLEIIIGNDQSEDDTRAIADAFAAQHLFISVTDIKPSESELVARSNVLAQLARVAKNEYLVFLDADMEPGADWLCEMVAPTFHGYDLVSGYTAVKAGDLLSRFQQMDWLSVIMLLKVAADLGMPGTALGNNMLVSRKAYRAIGGYEKIGSTYTEDNDLTLALTKKGYRLFQLVNAQGSDTFPLGNPQALWKQRIRWFRGAVRQPLWKLIPVLISRLFMLWVLLFSFVNWVQAIGLLLSVCFVELLLAYLMAAKTKTRLLLHLAFFAPVFNSLLDTFTLLSYPWNQKVTWKGRMMNYH